MTQVTDRKKIMKVLGAHLEGKFPKGVPKLRNFVFNTHARLEDWMAASITRASFKTIEEDKTINDVDLRGSIMGDASTQVHRLISNMEFHAILKTFLKNVNEYDPKMKKKLEESINTVNRIRNEFAHPYGNYDLSAYNTNETQGVSNQIDVLNKMLVALKNMEEYLNTYHKDWFNDVSKLYRKLK